MTILNTTSGSFAVGGGKRPLPIGLSGCEWRVSPPSPVTSITLSFDYFDIATTDYVDVYAGDDADAALVVSLSGPQLLQPLPLNSTSVFIKLRIAYGSQGYSGFQAKWTTSFIKVNQLMTIAVSSPAAIVFYVFLALGLVFFICLLAVLSRYRGAKSESRAWSLVFPKSLFSLQDFGSSAPPTGPFLR